MNPRARVTSVIAAAFATTLSAANPLSFRTDASGQHHAGELTQSSLTEIEAVKLAAKQSQAADVKGFAHRMMIDHAKLTVQLKMAVPHDVVVPKDTSDGSVLSALKPLKEKIDQMYIKKVGVEGHQQAVVVSQKEAQQEQNADLKKAAQKALPTIQDHLKMAQQLSANKGVK